MGDIAGQGMAAFVTDVQQRGGRAEPLDDQRTVKVRGTDGVKRVVRVRTTEGGPWLARRQDGIAGSDETGSSHWVFVDLGQKPPAFYIVESAEIEAGIEEEVALWLTERPGRTATGSHPIPLSGVAHGLDRWDLLGLDAVKDTTRTCAPTRRSPRRTAAPAARPAAQQEEVDPRVAVCADVGGYRVQGRFDTTTGALEITRGPMEGRRFPDPTTAADAVAGFLSGDIESHDGDTFWRLDGPKAPALGEYLARSS